MDLKFSSRIKSTRSNVLVYVTASLFGTVINNTGENVKITLPALEIKYQKMHDFSSFFCTPQLANNETSSFFSLPFLRMLSKFHLMLCPIFGCRSVLFRHQTSGLPQSTYSTQ